MSRHRWAAVDRYVTGPERRRALRWPLELARPGAGIVAETVGAKGYDGLTLALVVA